MRMAYVLKTSTANIFTSPRDASNTQLVTTSQSAYSDGGIDGTKSAVARKAVVKVMANPPSMSITTPANVNPRQRLSGREKLVDDTHKILNKLRAHVCDH